jgi:hypothetical protein
VKRHLASIIVAIVATTSLHAASSGKAKGQFVVGTAKKELRHAYVVEKNKLLKIVLSSTQLDDAALYDDNVLQNAVGSGVSAIVVKLDEDRKADATFFFDEKLPAGLEVRQTGRFTAKKSSDSELSGRVVMDDDGFSFSYDATFEAPILLQLQNVEPLASDASPADHALWRLKQMEIDFDEGSYRSAVLDGKADVVKLMLTAGMAPETSDALRLAVEGGHLEVVRHLIAHKANVNGKDAYGQSLVMSAASSHRPEVLKELIAAGADVNVANSYRITPLAVAAEQGHLDIIKILLAAKAKVNARDTSGGTALSVAVLRGYKEIVETLIATGADLKRDKEDLLTLAADKPEIKAILLKAMK